MKQEAELRAVLKENSSFALLVQVTVDGDDIYSALARTIGGRRRNLFRSSYHASGQTRLHLPVGTETGVSQVRPRDFRGRARFSGVGSGGQLDWSYRLKPDSATRRTLVVESARLRASTKSVNVWAIERGREDLVRGILSGEEMPHNTEIVGYVLSDWTQPQMMIVVSTPTLKGWAALTLAEVEEKLARETESSPMFAELLNLRGVCRMYLGCVAHALIDLDRAIEMRPSNAKYLYNRSCAHALGRRCREALRDLRDAVGLDRSYLQKALAEADFDSCRSDPVHGPDFRALVDEARGPDEVPRG